VNRLSVDPLTPRETRQLVAELLGHADALSDKLAGIAASCEGNPFFAEQSARLVTDAVRSAPVPATVQAVLAARLDALPHYQKAVLNDAAVVGGVFWDGAVVEVGQRDAAELDAALDDLIAKHLLRRVRASSMLGENEYAFAHALAREVAYGELPRAARAQKHAAVAGWMERKAGDRSDDLAEILAHHYSTALELASASGERQLMVSLVHPAVRFLTIAGDRIRPLDVGAAERHYARALDLAGPIGPQRPALLVRWAKAVTTRGRALEAVAPLEEAVVQLRAAGDVRAAALAQMLLGYALSEVDVERWHRLQAEAVASLEAEGPSPELLEALNDLVGSTWGQADPQSTLEIAQRAAAVADLLGLSLDPRAVAYRGCARCDMGDAGGLDDLRLALDMVRTRGGGEEAGTVYWAVAAEVYMFEGYGSTLETVREGLDYARRRGDVDTELALRGLHAGSQGPLGEWDAALTEAVSVEPLLEAASLAWMLAIVRQIHLQVLVQRGRAAEAEQLASLVAEDARREAGHIAGHTAAGCAPVAAAARLDVGERDDALELLALAEAAFRRPGGFWWCEFLPLAVRTAIAARDGALARSLAESIDHPLQPLSQHAVAAAQAMVTEARGDQEAASSAFADAAARWREFGMPYEEAQALLGQGRCLVALGRAPEAAAPLTSAREILERLGAKPALAETDDLMQQVASA
jgi:tetratricopeptide (TPR) repeat protein